MNKRIEAFIISLEYILELFFFRRGIFSSLNSQSFGNTIGRYPDTHPLV
jgi:hypothetical protein